LARAALLIAASVALAGAAHADTIRVPLNLVTPAGPGADVGTVTFSDGNGGVIIVLDLHGLPPGQHGFHVHANADCGTTAGPDGKPVPAGGAGGHFDPDKTAVHQGPAGHGHLGDLPRIDVAADGSAHQTLLAPRIQAVANLRGHAIVLHAGGDNYADQPAPLGGGGPRIACGVIAP
jgi:Cu-Zn family superoxide dismutase